MILQNTTDRAVQFKYLEIMFKFEQTDSLEIKLLAFKPLSY